MNVRIKRLHAAAVIPQYAHEHDAGFDLVAVKDVIVRPGETVRVPTGLAFEIPPDYEMQIRPRSGITSKTSLRTHLGTVDVGYRGQVAVIIENNLSWTNLFQSIGIIRGILSVTSRKHRKFLTLDHRKYEGLMVNLIDTFAVDYPVGTYIIRRGDRIAQAVIAPVIHANFAEADELSDTERGASGFGSSGVSIAIEAAAPGLIDQFIDMMRTHASRLK